MIDMEMLQRILTARRTAGVLFVGDPAQLPPINCRGTLSPVFDRVQNKAVLTEVVRQARENPIIALSMAIREAIERNEAMSPEMIMQALPVPETDKPVEAGVCFGGFDTITSIVADEIKEGVDCRAIAYTNQRVLAYNNVIHDMLHGQTATPYVPGERIIVHSAYDGKKAGGHRPVTLYTSEELQVKAIEQDNHPKYPDRECYRLELLNDEGITVDAYIPLNAAEFENQLSAMWNEWRQMKAEGDYNAGGLSRKIWALKNAFASIRHAYALTAHKSQGSTFETAVIDYPDLCRMKSTFEFNRALYVACTRASKHLAVVI
jgi:exodeoxyribonuclease-5